VIILTQSGGNGWPPLCTSWAASVTMRCPAFGAGAPSGWKRGRLEASGREGDAVGIFDEVVRRFGDDLDPAVRIQTAEALVAKAVALEKLERRSEALGVLDEVVGRFGDDPDPALRSRVATALVQKGLLLRLRPRRRGAEAIEGYEELLRRFDDDPDPVVRAHVAQASLKKRAGLEAVPPHE